MAVLAMILGALIVSMPTVMADAYGPEIDHTPVTVGTVGAAITIEANVTDADGIDEVRLNYTDVNGDWYNVSMVIVGDNHSYDIPAQAMAGSVVYNVSANDTIDNWNVTADSTITVSDDADPPDIEHTPVTEAGMDEAIPISANVTDNVEVDKVYLNYTDVDGDDFNVTMSKSGDTYSYDIPAQTSVGDVTYFIWANDTNGFEEWTSVNTITVSDTEAPDISHFPTIIGFAGDAIEISADITDNVGVDSATLYYRKGGETTYTSLEMTKDGDTYSATIPGEAVTIDDVYYYISATDGVNVATYPATDPTTDPWQIVIAGDIDWEIPWIWIIIAVVILIVIIVVAVVAAKRRGPSLEEEEFPPPFEEKEEEPPKP
jgi:hypothetical protein